MISVVLYNQFDARDAANEACLFLIWHKQGRAQPLLVVDGNKLSTFSFKLVFDAEEYGETITFSRGNIVACHELG